MDLLWALLTLPYAPVRGLTAVVKVVQREAESQLHNPSNIRRQLEELEEATAAGEISPAERDREQQQAVEEFVTGTAPTRPARPRGPSSTARRRQGGERDAASTTYPARRRR